MPSKIYNIRLQERIGVEGKFDKVPVERGYFTKTFAPYIETVLSLLPCVTKL